MPVLGLLAFAAVYGAAALYSPFGTRAVAEYYKFLAAFSLAVILLARFDREDVPGLLWGGSALSAFIGAVSVDLACDGPLFRAFNALVELLGDSFSSVVQNDWGTQIAGIYNDANVTASLFALGTVLSLYLLHRAEATRTKLPAALLLGVNALSFLLSMSRGGILCFAAALLVWLALSGRGERLPLFFLMAVSAASTVAVSLPAMGHIMAGSLLPLALLVGNGALIFALDRLLVRRLSALAAAHFKAGVIAAGVVLAVCVGYGIAAFTVTGPYTMDAAGVVVRQVDLAPGEYTLAAPLEDSVQIAVLGQTSYEKLTDQYQTLYHSVYTDGETFTVPEGMAALRLYVYAPEGTTVEAVTFTDGTRVELGYPLLPSFVADRVLLGMGSSFSLRWEYDKDAWTLFLQSPLLGHGLGSTEELYRSVQSFQYESKYAHNHLLQTLSDTGLAGTLCALAFMLGAGWLCLRARKRDPLAPALLAVWVMMNLHSLMEISFSVRGFKCFAYVLLILPVLLYAQPLVQADTAKARKTAQRLGLAVAAACAVYLAVFGGLLESRRMVMGAEFATSDVYEYLDYLKSAVRRNVFDHDNDALSYVGNAVQLKDPRYNGAMLQYAAELRASGTYENCSGLARYYYLPRGEWDELFACSREGVRQVRSSPDGWNLQLDFYRTEVLPAMGAENLETFLAGVSALREDLDTMNGAGRLEPVSFSEENQAFLNLIDSGLENGITGEVLYALLLTQGAQEDGAD